MEDRRLDSLRKIVIEWGLVHEEEGVGDVYAYLKERFVPCPAKFKVYLQGVVEATTREATS